MKLVDDNFPLKRVIKKENITKKALPINQKTLSTFNKQQIHFAKEDGARNRLPRVLPIAQYHVNVIHTPFTHPTVIADAPLTETKNDGHDIYFIPKGDVPVHIYISDGLGQSLEKISLLLVPKANIPGAEYDFNEKTASTEAMLKIRRNRADSIANTMISFINGVAKADYQEIDSVRKKKVLGCSLLNAQNVVAKSQQHFAHNDKIITATTLLNQSDYTQDLKMLICDRRHLLAATFFPGPRILPHGEVTLYVLRERYYEELLR